MAAVPRPRATLLATALATLLTAAGLVACGDDPYAGYCDAVKERQEGLSKTLDAGGPQALLEALPVFEELRDRAPADVEDDWAVLTKALTSLQDALEAAGVDPATYDPGKPAAGVSRQQQDRIAAAATQVGGARTREALAAVDQQARDVCHTPLTL
jgi:hypothetical protein